MLAHLVETFAPCCPPPTPETLAMPLFIRKLKDLFTDESFTVHIVMLARKSLGHLLTPFKTDKFTECDAYFINYTQKGPIKQLCH